MTASVLTCGHITIDAWPRPAWQQPFCDPAASSLQVQFLELHAQDGPVGAKAAGVTLPGGQAAAPDGELEDAGEDDKEEGAEAPAAMDADGNYVDQDAVWGDYARVDEADAAKIDFDDEEVRA